MFLLAVTPIVSGVDYLLGENYQSMTLIEKAIPLWIWGVLCIISGLSTCFGYLIRSPFFCIGGMWLTGSVFFTLAFGISWQSVDSAGGFRVPWLHLVVAIASMFSAMGYKEQLNAEQSVIENIGKRSE